MVDDKIADNIILLPLDRGDWIPKNTHFKRNIVSTKEGVDIVMSKRKIKSGFYKTQKC